MTTTRTQFIKGAIQKRLNESYIIQPVFIPEATALNADDHNGFGWLTPYKIITVFGAPRWIVPICAELITEQAHDLDDTELSDYVDAVIVWMVLQTNELSKGHSAQRTDEEVSKQLLDAHPDKYRVLTAVQMHVLDRK